MQNQYTDFVFVLLYFLQTAKFIHDFALRNQMREHHDHIQVWTFVLLSTKSTNSKITAKFVHVWTFSLQKYKQQNHIEVCTFVNQKHKQQNHMEVWTFVLFTNSQVCTFDWF